MLLYTIYFTFILINFTGQLSEVNQVITNSVGARSTTKAVGSTSETAMEKFTGVTGDLSKHGRTFVVGAKGIKKGTTEGSTRKLSGAGLISREDVVEWSIDSGRTIGVWTTARGIGFGSNFKDVEAIFSIFKKSKQHHKYCLM